MKFQDGGNTHDRARATEGYTLFAPVRHDKAYLINDGQPWSTNGNLGRGGINRCQLTESGNLLVNEVWKTGRRYMPGRLATLREYDWDGNLVWEHHDQYHHHDGRRLSNGNSMYIAWDPFDDALAVRSPVVAFLGLRKTASSMATSLKRLRPTASWSGNGVLGDGNRKISHLSTLPAR